MDKATEVQAKERFLIRLQVNWHKSDKHQLPRITGGRIMKLFPQTSIL